MEIRSYEDEASWLDARRGLITGSKAFDVSPKERGTGYRKGFYALIADRLALPDTGENPMDRGHRLEDEALDRYEAMTEKKVERQLCLWVSDENKGIAVSPDAFIMGKKGKIKEAVEIKCLDAANHIEILLTKEVPKEYIWQVRQYFVVNKELEHLSLCFYNPLLKVKDFFIIEYHRKDVQADVEAMLEHETKTLAEVDRIVKELSEF